MGDTIFVEYVRCGNVYHISITVHKFDFTIFNYYHQRVAINSTK